MADPRKADTVSLQGGAEYAKVAERLKLFRQDSPNGNIETSNTALEDGQIEFKAIVIKDGNNPNVGRATGHSRGTVKGQKDFEKLETIAVGRALAMLGYLASGEIASSEEMEEFAQYMEEKHQKAVDEAVDSFKNANTIDELKQAFLATGQLMRDDKIKQAKDARKAELTSAEEDDNAKA